jgi:glyoxylase-like metal-dependent hydrolase (beta-lactamase superfamily II)
MSRTAPQIIRLPVGQLQSNCYIYQVGKKSAVVIDPGDDDQYIIENLQKSELTPVAILATHGHFDHLLAGFSLQAAFNVPFYMHTADKFLLDRMRQTAIHFKEADPGPSPIVTKFFDDKTLELVIEDTTLIIITTPGHTPGSVSYFDKNNNVVFVGDLLFADGSIGEVTHAYSDRVKTKSSIKKIVGLPDETVVCAGHGEETSVAELKEQFKWALV